MSATVSHRPSVLAIIHALESDHFPAPLHPLLGHPLLAWSICAAQDAKQVDHLIVATNRAEIADIAKEYGAEVLFPFPEEPHRQPTTAAEMLALAVTTWERIHGRQPDIIVELPFTAPLRDGSDIDHALERLSHAEVHSVVGVSPAAAPPVAVALTPGGQQISGNPDTLPAPSGDRKPRFILNGTLFAMRRNLLIEQRQRCGLDPHITLIPPQRAVLVREPWEMQMVESLLRDGHSGNRPAKKEQVIIERHIQGGRPLVLVTVNMSFLPHMRTEMARVVDCIFAYGANRQTIVDILPDIDAWLCSPVPPYLMDGPLLELATRLKVLATPSTGSNHIDMEWCRKKGIPVACLKDTAVVNTIYASSEFTWALIMTIMRRVHMAIARVRQNYWRDVENELRTVEFHGKTMGIIGFGRIGGNIARYAQAFRMNILAFDPHKTIAQTGVLQVHSAQEVLRAADCVLISVHLDDSTRGMVTKEWYAAMKRGAVFVNVSRGEIIDEAALLDALDRGHLSGAALDVISDEYLSDKRQHPVLRHARSHENLVVTPHIAGLTVDSEYKAARFAFDAILHTLAPEKNA
ncbi:MAG: hypothetical protein HQL81_03735 [Magnetococcales bacterium]|nr:hypothetical protein [Magnetococcales bacterium]MBF0630995.1 hypothetical protein [Magnetococcales bacterium]